MSFFSIIRLWLKSCSSPEAIFYQIAQLAGRQPGPQFCWDCLKFACQTDSIWGHSAQIDIWTSGGPSVWVDWSRHFNNWTAIPLNAQKTHGSIEKTWVNGRININYYQLLLINSLLINQLLLILIPSLPNKLIIFTNVVRASMGYWWCSIYSHWGVILFYFIFHVCVNIWAELLIRSV